MLSLNLFSTLTNEEEVFNALASSFNEVLQKNNANPEKLCIKKGKSYSSVWYDTQMAFRVCCRDDCSYFGISSTYAQYIPEQIIPHISKKQKAPGFVNLEFEPTLEQVSLFTDFLCYLIDLSIDAIPKQYDCCSRYNECSDIGYCIHPSPDMAIACGYRKILKRGSIYFGNNRNI